jgi:hypothetical protein
MNISYTLDPLCDAAGHLGPTEARYAALPQLEHEAAPNPLRERLHVVVLVAHKAESASRPQWVYELAAVDLVRSKLTTFEVVGQGCHHGQYLWRWAPG